MNFKKSGNVSNDLEFIRNISRKIDRKISQTPKSIDSKIDKLTLEELQDLSKITGLADFMLTKYEDKKETKSILEYLCPHIFSLFICHLGENRKNQKKRVRRRHLTLEMGSPRQLIDMI